MDIEFYNSSDFKFSLEREGTAVHVHIEALPDPFQNVVGLDVWDGSLRSKLGTAGDFEDREENQEFWLVNDYAAGLTPGVASAGFFHFEGAYQSDRQERYLVTIFDNAANFTGTSNMDLVFGSTFADTFRSTIGRDVFEGGAGNDLYLIHHFGTNVVEASGEGIADRVATSISYTLSAGTEIEELRTTMATATTALKLTGNEFAQTIIANAGNNILDGKGGADVMIGGAGDDIYYVDNAGDTIIERGGGGQDRVAVVDISYALNAGARVEMLTTDDSKGALALSLTGNKYNQTIVGNAGDNVLDGNRGIDTLVGGLGNDTYYVDSSDDIVIDRVGQGTDVVAVGGVDYVLGETAQVERLRTSAATGTTDIDITGNDFAQIITGNAGNNILAGRGGNDKLYGLDGADAFLFDSAFGSSNRDVIYDFGVGDDQIILDRAVFTALGIGALAASAFKDIAVGLQDSNDRILYNSDDGRLYYDADGYGGTDMILFAAVLNPFRNPASLTAADFSVI